MTLALMGRAGQTLSLPSPRYVMMRPAYQLLRQLHPRKEHREVLFADIGWSDLSNKPGDIERKVLAKRLAQLDIFQKIGMRKIRAVSKSSRACSCQSEH